MMLSSPDAFEVENEEYRFEVQAPLYGRRPLPGLDPETERLGDRFHRTVKITRMKDSRSWTGASDIKPQHLNGLAEYLQLWLERCFSRWDLNAIPDGFDIPQDEVPREPSPHRCPEYPVIEPAADAVPTDIVDAASEASFPASDPPEWIGARVA